MVLAVVQWWCYSGPGCGTGCGHCPGWVSVVVIVRVGYPFVVPLLGLVLGGSHGLRIGVHCVSPVDHEIKRRTIWE